MNYKSNLFPEYNTNSKDDIYPDHEETFNGWVLRYIKLKTKI